MQHTLVSLGAPAWSGPSVSQRGGSARWQARTRTGGGGEVGRGAAPPRGAASRITWGGAGGGGTCDGPAENLAERPRQRAKAWG